MTQITLSKYPPPEADIYLNVFMTYRHLFGLVIFLALFHVFATYAKLYFLFPYVDVPMHMLGGFVAGAFVLHLYNGFGSVIRGGLVVTILVFFLSLVWEYSSFVFDPSEANKALVSRDTLSDTISSLFGAFLSVLHYHYYNREWEKKN